jgi:hypothetical protein
MAKISSKITKRRMLASHHKRLTKITNHYPIVESSPVKDSMDNLNEKLLRSMDKLNQKLLHSLKPCIEDIDFLIENLLKKEDVKIEHGHNCFHIKYENSNNYVHINIFIDEIEMRSEIADKLVNYDDSRIVIKSNSFYDKWSSILEEKYIIFFNKKTSKIVNEILEVTKLSRKIKIKKMDLDKDNQINIL